jgi:hypothetical protein
MPIQQEGMTNVMEVMPVAGNKKSQLIACRMKMTL